VKTLLLQIELWIEYKEFLKLGYSEEETVGYISYIFSKYYADYIDLET